MTHLGKAAVRTVTGSSLPRQPEGAGARPGPGGDALQDPWGVRRAEQLLQSLEGILSARIVTTPLGEVSEVHVLAQAGLQPKQLVRNIESALLAQLGLKVDHRKISIAQTAETRPLAAVAEGPVAVRAAGQRALLFDRVVVAPSPRPHRITIGVTLCFEDRIETAEEEAPDAPKARLEAAARATLAVLERLVPGCAMAVEGVKVVSAFEREFVMVAVRSLGGRDSLFLTGTAEVREGAERAAVLAALDATNRWTQSRGAG